MAIGMAEGGGGVPGRGHAHLPGRIAVTETSGAGTPRKPAMPRSTEEEKAARFAATAVTFAKTAFTAITAWTEKKGDAQKSG